MAVWRGVGSSPVANIEEVEGGSSTGPSAGGGAVAVVGSSDSRAVHNLWAEQ